MPLHVVDTQSIRITCNCCVKNVRKGSRSTTTNRQQKHNRYHTQGLFKKNKKQDNL